MFGYTDTSDIKHKCLKFTLAHICALRMFGNKTLIIDANAGFELNQTCNSLALVNVEADLMGAYVLACEKELKRRQIIIKDMPGFKCAQDYGRKILINDNRNICTYGLQEFYKKQGIQHVILISDNTGFKHTLRDDIITFSKVKRVYKKCKFIFVIVFNQQVFMQLAQIDSEYSDNKSIKTLDKNIAEKDRWCIDWNSLLPSSQWLKKYNVKHFYCSELKRQSARFGARILVLSDIELPGLLVLSMPDNKFTEIKAIKSPLLLEYKPAITMPNFTKGTSKCKISK